VIHSLSVHEFGAFTDLRLRFTSGINVFIGENGTGKSQLLKLLYAFHKSAEAPIATAVLGGKLERIFKPDNLGRLVHRRVGRNIAKAEARIADGGVSFTLKTHNTLKALMAPGPSAKEMARSKAIFIPSREALTLFEGFIGLYETRELSIDETYYDLCVALDTPALRGPREEKAAALVAPIEAALGGKVVHEGRRFYVRGRDGDLEAHLVSEGLRKLATLARLVTNGSLANKGVLFWDEPEANLNPRLTRQLIEFLRRLAAQGVQIFLATHDALVTQRLSLAAEYEQEPVVPIQFLALMRDESGAIRDRVADSLADLTANPILDEYARYYEDERKAFEKALGKGASA
jgi:ABC-type ATPase involved in cell division